MASWRAAGEEWPFDLVAAPLGVSLDGPTRGALATWLDLLVTWNARVDLTAARGADELVDLMLADAVVLSKACARGARVIDVGTGAGAPGLALAILRPDLHVTMAEPLAKRSAFLRTVLGTLGRTDVALAPVKGEALVGSATWDVAVARATLPPAAWLALGAELAGEEGSVWVLLAKDTPPDDARMIIAEDVRYTWPLTEASRRAVRYARRSVARPQRDPPLPGHGGAPDLEHQ